MAVSRVMGTTPAGIWLLWGALYGIYLIIERLLTSTESNKNCRCALELEAIPGYCWFLFWLRWLGYLFIQIYMRPLPIGQDCSFSQWVGFIPIMDTIFKHLVLNRYGADVGVWYYFNHS